MRGNKKQDLIPNGNAKIKLLNSKSEKSNLPNEDNDFEDKSFKKGDNIINTRQNSEKRTKEKNKNSIVEPRDDSNRSKSSIEFIPTQQKYNELVNVKKEK